jgi:hypothetical protein
MTTTGLPGPRLRKGSSRAGRSAKMASQAFVVGCRSGPANGVAGANLHGTGRRQVV